MAGRALREAHARFYRAPRRPSCATAPRLAARFAARAEVGRHAEEVGGRLAALDVRQTVDRLAGARIDVAARTRRVAARARTSARCVITIGFSLPIAPAGIVCVVCVPSALTPSKSRVPRLFFASPFGRVGMRRKRHRRRPSAPCG